MINDITKNSEKYKEITKGQNVLKIKLSII